MLGRQGVFGFLICLAGFVSIKVTSPISHMVSAGEFLSFRERDKVADRFFRRKAVRGVLQTFLGVYLFGDIVSACVSVLVRLSRNAG